MKTPSRAYEAPHSSRQRSGLRRVRDLLSRSERSLGGNKLEAALGTQPHKILPVLASYAAFPTRTSTPSHFYLLLLTILTLLALSACKSPNSSTSATTSPKDAIAQLNVITVPVALDLDGQPGPDGIALKLYASHASNPKAIRIGEGTLEILLFDGTFHGRTNPPPILRTATFTPAELRLNEFKSNIGYGYDLTLRWGTNLPTQRLISVGARYTPPNGRPLVSRTSSVTVLNK